MHNPTHNTNTYSSDATSQQSTAFTLIIRPLSVDGVLQRDMLTMPSSVHASQIDDQQSQQDDTASTRYHHYTADDDIKQSRQSTIANK